MPRKGNVKPKAGYSGCQWPGCGNGAFTEVAPGVHLPFRALCREHRTDWEDLPLPAIEKVAWQSRTAHRKHAKAAKAPGSGRRARRNHGTLRPKRASTSLGGEHS